MIDLSATASSVVPIPAAVWLFGSGLLGLVGIARRKYVA
ncbi:MAG: VPLPA-CTERM sorting domain-containing protein [Pseudomonadota bacterium]|nr:VPLPA-CTERM sorting domain-containing protein [Pseudomonadota bacterium]